MGLMTDTHTSSVVLQYSCDACASRKARRQANETPSAGKAGSAIVLAALTRSGASAAEASSSLSSSSPESVTLSTSAPVPSAWPGMPRTDTRLPFSTGTGGCGGKASSAVARTQMDGCMGAGKVLHSTDEMSVKAETVVDDRCSFLESTAPSGRLEAHPMRTR
eukprot:scaffold3737_cov137-Isochrysis_galbana.AAC.2